ncbi:ESPR-type extended signal peptide-containing protein [Stenotrophomonas sp.]|uniref:ESPR-type extended signal peptide-containing protein n=1 Tax=Stenotrophomonas sp. TaxID=69392 RepID=UPI0028A99DD1|nr:ESPR-type extended signal peptide-containing protein [Stenotrophomonas sp.]
MNRIFRLIWSAARQGWVVASELGARRGKAPQRLALACALVCALPYAVAADDTVPDDEFHSSLPPVALPWHSLAPVFGARAGAIIAQNTVYQSAIVTDLEYRNATASGDRLMVLGSRASISGSRSVLYGNHASVSGSRSVGVGDGVRVQATSATAVGHAAQALGGHGATALGNDTIADGGNALALGSGAQVSTGGGLNGIAIGGNARAGSYGWTGAVALGGESLAGHDSVALGYASQATHKSSVALGRDSVTTGDRQISVGNASTKRRIVNVADGALSTSSSEAVTGKQLHATNQSVSTATNAANTARTHADRALTALASAKTAIGQSATAAGSNAVAVGFAAKAEGTHSNALGYQASSAGSNAVGLGTLATAAGSASVALGNRSGVDTGAGGGVALGDRAQVGAQAGNSVALGAGSVATAANQVSVGSATLKRKIVNVADATLSTTSAEVVTGKQLHATNQNVTTATTTASTARTTATDALAKANVLGGLLSQSAGNGDVRVGASNTGGVVDMRNQSNANRRVTGVADAVLSTSSTDAVSGRQLNTTNLKVSAATTLANTAHTVANLAQTTANDAQSKAIVLGGLISQVAANGDVRLGAGNAGAVLDVRNQNNQNRRIRGVAEGVLAATSNEAVSGRQLFASNVQIALNREDIDSLRSDFADFDPDLSGVVRFDEEGSVSLDGGRLVALAEGDLSDGSREAVTGGQLFVTNERVSVLEDASKYAVVGHDEYSEGAQAGLLAIAMGSDTMAMEEGATAIGSYARALGKNSVSLGRAALVNEGAEDGFALGARAQVHIRNGVALGGGSQVQPGAANSVALGHDSIAYGANEVSIGHSDLKRRITNAANGIQRHDLTTVDQLSGVVNALGGGAGFAADGNVIAPSYSVQGVAHGSVGAALSALDVEVNSTQNGLDAVGERLHALDQARAATDATAVRFDADRSTVDFGGAHLGNVANGMIAAGSRDAVNGGQLHAVQEQINGRIDGLRSQIEGPAAAGSRHAAVDSAAAGDAPAGAQAATDAEAPTDAQAPASPVKGVPAVASADAPTPAPQADDPLPAVDSRAVDEAVNQANAYTDQAMASVDRKLDRMDKRLNRMAAMGSAQAAMAMNTAGLQTYNRLGAGVGHADGESALAVGYQRVLNERGLATFSLNGAFTNSGERTMGVGFGVGW